MSEELVTRFENPATGYGPVPLWWWSGDTLDPARLRWQLDQLVSQGVHQAVVMNLAPTGPLYGALADDPPFMSDAWWEIFAGACEYASTIGFQIWLYDQIGFSGANIQGRIVASEPRLAGQSLGQLRVAVDGSATVSAPEGATALSAWYIAPGATASVPVGVDGNEARYEAEGGELVIAFAATRGFDYFSSEASARLIDAIFGEYDRHVGQWFGTAIGGVFQDELPDMPSWSTGFADEFASFAGYDLLAELPALWGDPQFAGSTKDAGIVRVDYHRNRAQLAERSFFQPLADWLAGAGLECGFDQQSPAREGDPVGAVSLYGDYLSTHSRFGIPGSDHWGDSKVHSSMAHAHGHERVWIESFHSSGWGGTLEETYDWLSPYFRRGANLYDPHAMYYSTRSGWFEWAPPSTCWRQPYWPDYREFAVAVARICSALTTGVHTAPTVLFFPTENAQYDVTANGRDLGDGRSALRYHELNGSTAWFAEKRGVLERAGLDYDILGSDTLKNAALADGDLVVGSGRFRNVVLPGVTVLDAGAARVLLDFAGAGGTIVCTDALPAVFAGASADEGARLSAGFDAGVARGAVRVVQSAEDVPAALAAPRIVVTASAPYVHRLVGDSHLIALIAHDDESGTVQPMLPNLADDAWVENGDAFNWTVYWHDLATDGYEFRPPGDRQLSVSITGLGGAPLAVQQWDPRTGERFSVPSTQDGDSLTVDTDFRTGSIVFLVLAPSLPDPTASRRGTEAQSLELDGAWDLTAESTLDNRWGDLGPVSETGTLPVQVWEFEHETDEESLPSSGLVTATFGPFAWVSGPGPDWTAAVWSLSRGIHNDTIHDDSLGPNGYVPEEFLSWQDAKPGETYRVKTTIAIPDAPGVVLAVGANAERRVFLDGIEQPVEGDGYLSVSPVAAGTTASLELEFTAVADQPLRASFALTSDLEAYRRPEWIVPIDGAQRSTGVVFRTSFVADGTESDTRIQVSSEAPTVIRVNGVEVGRQGDFDPYADRRFTRVHPYDLAQLVKPGENSIEISCVDLGRPVALRVDSAPRPRGGFGVVSGTDWTAERESRTVGIRLRREQYEDPRYGCIVPRPHPLQDATWLEPAAAAASVIRLIPDAAGPGAAPEGGRVERLRFIVPIGATQIEVPTGVPFEVEDAADVRREGTTLRFDAPAAAGRRLSLVFRPVDGRRGGALVDGPLVVTASEPVSAELAPWASLGLGSLGGAVHYRRRLTVPAEYGTDAGSRIVLDLGSLRGTVSVSVDGVRVQTLFAGPWVVDLTEQVRPGSEHELTVTVRGTLAPYLQYASPTSAVTAGQTVHGLFGPVRVENWVEASADAELLTPTGMPTPGVLTPPGT